VPSVRPLVSVLVAVHNGARHVQPAIESVLRQTVDDLELVVVDDASEDETSSVLEQVGDSRLVVLRNDGRLGLAGALNLGLERCRGRYVARMDADDVAFPYWLGRQVRELQERPELSIVGAGVVDVAEAGRAGSVHLLPSGLELRWHALFSSPFLHNTVVIERDVLESHGLRYDETFAESEDYDLWTRLLAVAEGENVQQPLVLYRQHEGQATSLRRDVQREFQQRVARREISALAPHLDDREKDLAWLAGLGRPVPRGSEPAAEAAIRMLLERFEQRWGENRYVRRRAARSLARSAPGSGASPLLVAAFRLAPEWPVRLAVERARRRSSEGRARKNAERWLAELELRADARPLRVTAVFPEPTPYRAPLLDRIAALPDLDLTVLYAAHTVAGRTWDVRPQHPATVLRSVSVPGSERILRHDYAITPGIAAELDGSRPDVVVVSGWSTFAAQAAIAWCRLRHVPYVLVVESHDEDERPPWRRLIKDTVVPRVVVGASGGLVTGTLARRSMVARGAEPDRVHVFANTIDAEAFAARADGLALRRAELRSKVGAGEDVVVVISVGRLVPDKGMDLLVQAVARVADARLLLVLVGDGPERPRLDELGSRLGVRLVLAGDRPWERISELYAAADVFALLSRREPWGVVVNEAGASGLPLVLSRAVGAAHDLLRGGENGFLVATDNVDAAAEAIGRLATDATLREAFGARSREIAGDWGYGPSVEGFLAAVREAAARPPD